MTEQLKLFSRARVLRTCQPQYFFRCEHLYKPKKRTKKSIKNVLKIIKKITSNTCKFFFPLPWWLLGLGVKSFLDAHHIHKSNGMQIFWTFPNIYLQFLLNFLNQIAHLTKEIWDLNSESCICSHFLMLKGPSAFKSAIQISYLSLSESSWARPGQDLHQNRCNFGFQTVNITKFYLFLWILLPIFPCEVWIS